MVWIYLAESAGSLSLLKNGLDPYVTVKLTDFANPFCSHGSVITSFITPPFGTISEVCIPGHLLKLTSSMEASHVKTLALQEMEKAWQESEADCFTRSLDCVARLSHDSSFWKMYLPLLPEAEQKWSEKLPRWGMIVAGALYPLHPLERYIGAKGGSYWPTPTSTQVEETYEGYRKRMVATGNPKNIGKMKPQNLAMAVKMWPTPTSRDCQSQGFQSGMKRHSPDLSTAVKMWPTPTVQDAENCGSPSQMKRKSPALNAQVSGKLNPMWVEWLMGYPTGWINCEPWAIAWFRSRSKKRSKS